MVAALEKVMAIGRRITNRRAPIRNNPAILFSSPPKQISTAREKREGHVRSFVTFSVMILGKDWRAVFGEHRTPQNTFVSTDPNYALTIFSRPCLTFFVALRLSTTRSACFTMKSQS